MMAPRKKLRAGEDWCRECGGDGYSVALGGPGGGTDGLSPREVKASCDACAGSGVNTCESCGETAGLNEANLCAGCAHVEEATA